MKMEEAKISINYIFRALKRNWTYIIYFVVCFFAIGGVYAIFFNTPSYKSEGLLSTNSFNNTQTIKEIVENEEIVAKVVQQEIVKDGLTHKNGGLIDLSEISSGINAIVDSSAPQVKIEYTNSDSTVVQLILNKILEVSEEEINNLHSNFDVKISSPASIPVNLSQSNIKIIVLFTVAGLSIGVIAAIITENRHNILYEPADFEDASLKVFEIAYDKEKKANEII